MNQNTQKKKICLCLILIVLNLGFIWGNSLIPGDLSGQISDFLRKLLFRPEIGPSGGAETGGHFLRKLAHVMEFTSLGFLLTWLFRMLRKKLWIPFICGSLAAVLDELIQCFVPDRGPHLTDILIDTGGVAMGLCLFLLGSLLYQKTKHLEDKKL